LNDTDYTDVSDLTVTTLEDIVYMSVRYKILCSVVLESVLVLMSRCRYYFQPHTFYKDLKNKTIHDNYNSNQVTASDTSINCNSVKFQPAMEITAHMININIGNNAELMKKCRLLHDYAAFIGLIRDYISQENDINTAVTLAINQAISHNILKEVLSVHTAEVRDMILTEYNEEQHIKNEKNISYDDGFNDGKIEAIKNMIKLNVPKDKILECYSEAEYNLAVDNIND